MAAALLAAALAGCGGFEDSGDSGDAAGARIELAEEASVLAHIDLPDEGQVQLAEWADQSVTVAAVLSNQASPDTLRKLQAIDVHDLASTYASLAPQPEAPVLERLKRSDERRKSAGAATLRTFKNSAGTAAALGSFAQAYCEGGLWESTRAFRSVRCTTLRFSGNQVAIDSADAASMVLHAIWHASQLVNADGSAGSGSSYTQEMRAIECSGVLLGPLCAGPTTDRRKATLTVPSGSHGLIIQSGDLRASIYGKINAGSSTIRVATARLLQNPLR